MKASWLVLILLAVAGAAGCGAPPPPEKIRQLPLTGEVLAVKADKSEVQVKHDEVKGFMEPMTMWFNIKDPRLLDGIAPGDLISATLILTAEDSHLTAIRKTGSPPPGQATAPPPAPARAQRRSPRGSSTSRNPERRVSTPGRWCSRFASSSHPKRSRCSTAATPR